MSDPYLLDYVFNGDPENVMRMKIDNKYLNKGYIDFQDINELLHKEKVKFHPDSIRYYNYQDKHYWFFDESKQIELVTLETKIIKICVKEISFSEIQLQQAQKDIFYLNARVKKLEDILFKKPPIQPRRPYEDNRLQIIKQKSVKNQRDISIMFSDPLLTEDEKFALEGVNYEDEINQLKEALQKEKKKITITTSVLTLDSIQNWLDEKPKILHLMCHGDFDKEKGEYFLAIEGENAKQHKLYPEQLKKLFSPQMDQEQTIKMVFVNACYSEAIGNVFLECGIPTVVCVQADLAISDDIARDFSTKFYQQLLKGTTVRDAFVVARQLTSAQNNNKIFTCCCGHSHMDNCSWQKLLNEKGRYIAHKVHTPSCSKQQCPHADQFQHHLDCSFANLFYTEYVSEDRGNDGDNQLCCCRGPRIKHNETLKFKLLGTQQAKNQKIFHTNQSGRLEDETPEEFEFPKKICIGQNKIRQNLYSLLKNRKLRVIQVFGSDGSGKSFLCKNTAIYLRQRNLQFQKSIYIDLSARRSLNDFLYQILRNFDDINDEQQLYQYLKDKRIIFIFDNCDHLLQNLFKKFMDKIMNLVEQTQRCQIIFISNKSQVIKENFDQHKYDSVKTLQIKQFTKDEAIKFFQIITQNNLYYDRQYDYKQLYELEIFNGLIPLYPRDLININKQLSFRVTLRDIIEELKRIQKDTNNQTITTHDLEIKNFRRKYEQIKNTSEKALNWLIFLSLFRNGLLQKDICQLERLKFVDTCSQEEDDFFDYDKETKINKEQEIFDFKWIEKIKDAEQKNNNKFIVISQVRLQLKEHISSQNQQEYETKLYENKLKSYKYVAFLCQSIIQRFKMENIYDETYLEMSAYNDFGLWKTVTICKKDGEIIKEIPYREFTDQSKDENYILNKDLINIKDVKQIIDTLNFMKWIQPNYVQEILLYIKSNSNVNDKKEANFLKCLEIISMCILTIQRCLKNNVEQIQETAEQILQFAQSKQLKGILKYLEVKIDFFLITLNLENLQSNKLLQDKSDSKNLFKLINLQLLRSKESYESIFGNVKLKSEIKANYEYLECAKMIKENKKYSLQFNEKDHTSFLNSFNQKIGVSIQLYKKYNLKLSEAKAIYLQTKIKIRSQKYPTKTTLQELKNAIQIFETSENNCIVLANKVKYYLAYFKFNSAEQLSEYSQVKSLCEQIIKQGQNYILTNQVYKSKGILKKVDKKLGEKQFNVFAFLLSSPLVKEINDNNGEIDQFYQLESPQFPMFTIPQKLRQEMTDYLNTKNKEILLQFRYLTEETLAQLISKEKSCKILQMKFEIQQIKQEEFIIIESDKYHAAKKLRFAALNKILTGQGAKDIELLVLVTNDGLKIANLLLKDKKFKHIVTFDFKNNQNYIHTRIINLYQECFCKEFYGSLIEGSSIKNSYEKAKQVALNLIALPKYLNKKETDCLSILKGKNGAVLLPFQSSHEPVLFDNLQKGKVTIINKMKNIKGVKGNPIQPFFNSRKKLFFLAIRYIKEKQKTLLIKGKIGVGSALFAKRLGWYFASKSIFDDGVFYIQFKNKIKGEQTLQGYIKNQIGIINQSLNFQTFFKDKKMLLILDDIEILISKRKNQIKEVLKIFEQNNIRLIIMIQKGKQIFKRVQEFFVKQQNLKEQYIHSYQNKEKTYYVYANLIPHIQFKHDDDYEENNILDKIEKKLNVKPLLDKDSKQLSQLLKSIQDNPNNLKKFFLVDPLKENVEKFKAKRRKKNKKKRKKKQAQKQKNQMKNKPVQEKKELKKSRRGSRQKRKDQSKQLNDQGQQIIVDYKKLEEKIGQNNTKQQKRKSKNASKQQFQIKEVEENNQEEKEDEEKVVQLRDPDRFSMSLESNKQKYKALKEHYSQVEFKPKKQLKLFNVKLPSLIGKDNPNQKIFYRNQEELNKKIQRMKEGGIDNFQILADNDRTISSGTSVTSFGVVRRSPLIPKELLQSLKELFNIYYPYECKQGISHEEKFLIVEEWCQTSRNCYQKHNLSEKLMLEVINDAKYQLRYQFPELFKYCMKRNIHFSIVSAGLADIIATSVNQIDDISKYENFKITGQEFVFDKSGTIIDFEMKINAVGKHTIMTNERIGNRKNLMILGDILDDVNMAQNIDYDNLISIGFLNKPKDLMKDVKNFFTKYDVVIANDGTMEEVNRIIQQIIPPVLEFS